MSQNQLKQRKKIESKLLDLVELLFLHQTFFELLYFMAPHSDVLVKQKVPLNIRRSLSITST